MRTPVIRGIRLHLRARGLVALSFTIVGIVASAGVVSGTIRPSGLLSELAVSVPFGVIFAPAMAIAWSTLYGRSQSDLHGSAQRPYYLLDLVVILFAVSVSLGAAALLGSRPMLHTAQSGALGIGIVLAFLNPLRPIGGVVVYLVWYLASLSFGRSPLGDSVQFWALPAAPASPTTLTAALGILMAGCLLYGLRHR